MKNAKPLPSNWWPSPAQLDIDSQNSDALTDFALGLKRPPREKSFLFSFALLLIGYAVLRGPLALWVEDGPLLFSTKELLAIAGCLIAFVAIRCGIRKMPSPLHPSAYLLGACLIFASDWLVYRYNFFQGPTIRGEIFCGGLLALYLLRQRFLGVFAAWVLLLSACLTLSFLQLGDGRFIFSDDHTSVMYRLALLRENFPHIPFYNPQWNAGMDARDFFSTGILNLYLLFYPLWQYFPVEEIYNGILATVVFVLVPLVMFAAGRILGLARLEAALGGAFSLCSSLIWYRWCLKYGAMGFVTSLMLLPLIVALGIKILRAEEELTPGEALIFVVISGLALCWAMVGISVLPLALYAVIRLRRIFHFKRIRIVAGALAVLTVPWVIIWLNVADVFQFVQHTSTFNRPVDSTLNSAQTDDSKAIAAPAPVKKRGKMRRRGVAIEDFEKSIRDFARNTNPLILLFGFPGIFYLRGQKSRGIYLALVAWLLLLGVAVAQFKPQLELDRMLVICSALLCIPAGKFFGEVLLRISGRDKPWTPQIVASLACGFFFAGLPSTGAIVWNRSLENYFFSAPIVENISKAIILKGGEGRTLFAGFTLHELNNGHVAPLAYFTKHPLIASSPFHNTWWYTDVIPEYYRETGPAAIEEYFNALNVTSVISHDPTWRKFFNERPESYEKAWEEDRFTLYQRKGYQPTYFLQGQGVLIGQSSNTVTIRVDSTESVIKFHYLPFLRSSSCELSPFRLPDGSELIQLKKCTAGDVVEISSVGAYERVIQ